jgi:hypothetical protein
MVGTGVTYFDETGEGLLTIGKLEACGDIVEDRSINEGMKELPIRLLASDEVKFEDREGIWFVGLLDGLKELDNADKDAGLDQVINPDEDGEAETTGDTNNEVLVDEADNEEGIVL